MQTTLKITTLTLLLTTGCPTPKDHPRPQTPPPPTTTPSFTHLKFQGKYTDTLNAWLHENPTKRITTIAGILQYRDNLQSCIIHHNDNPTPPQRIIEITQPNEQGVCHDLTDKLTPLQTLSTKHTIITFTTIPAYSGGAKGYLICIEDTPETKQP